ncbi:SRPBCC family protein, partial [Paraburkholderia caffeinilytica]|uniref:SRPBCC family protein n=1 Tax=Paraburkholderia caffeinilytica TaxID=1761016 RepID=UPI0038BBD467
MKPLWIEVVSTPERLLCDFFDRKEFILNLAKRVIYGFAGVVFLGVLAILALHHNGSIETETLIDSSPQTVWTVLTATDDYPLWNPEISRLRGQLREGNVIEFVEGTGPDTMVFHPRVLTVQAVRELRWKGYVWFPGIFDGEHRFILETAGNKTRFIQGETFTGILAGTLTRSVLRDTVNSMHAMNDALKKRAELVSSQP